jgi:beta-mannosidase
MVYFAAAKDLALPDPGLRTELRRDGDAYRLDLQASRLARGVWIGFGDLEAEVSDNALSLLPGETVRLKVRSKAGLAELRQALTLRSLFD